MKLTREMVHEPVHQRDHGAGFPYGLEVVQHEQAGTGEVLAEGVNQGDQRVRLVGFGIGKQAQGLLAEIETTLAEGTE